MSSIENKKFKFTLNEELNCKITINFNDFFMSYRICMEGPRFSFLIGEVHEEWTLTQNQPEEPWRATSYQEFDTFSVDENLHKFFATKEEAVDWIIKTNPFISLQKEGLVNNSELVKWEKN